MLASIEKKQQNLSWDLSKMSPNLVSRRSSSHGNGHLVQELPVAPVEDSLSIMGYHLWRQPAEPVVSDLISLRAHRFEPLRASNRYAYTFQPVEAFARAHSTSRSWGECIRIDVLQLFLLLSPLEPLLLCRPVHLSHWNSQWSRKVAWTRANVSRRRGDSHPSRYLAFGVHWWSPPLQY